MPPLAFTPSFFIAFFLLALLAYANAPLYSQALGSSEEFFLSERGRLLLGLFVPTATFLSVTLHEIGHALVAQRLGVGVERIALWFLGGVAVLKGVPKDPKKESLIVSAGPAVSFALAGLFHSLHLYPFWRGEEVVLSFLKYLSVVNLFIGVFNLVPAFPLDGGRLLRDLLALRIPWDRATLAALRIASFFAFLFVFLGTLASNPFLVAGGVLIYLHNRSLAKKLRETGEGEGEVLVSKSQ